MKKPRALRRLGAFLLGSKFNLRTRLRVAAAVALFSGLAIGGGIYLGADDEREASAYVVIGDNAYPIDPTISKTYVLQLERFGGKSAVLFDELNRWFESLWHGKTLGLTLASLGVVAALGLFLVSRMV